MKRDLPTAVALDTVHLSGGLAASASAEGMGAYGAMLRPGNISAKVLATNNMTVLATYDSDGTPASTHRRVGEGQAVAIAFLPSLAYFKPSLPNRPIDICPRDGATQNTRADSLRDCSQVLYCRRAGHDGCFCHFVPRAFDKSAAELLDLPSAEPHNRLAVVRSNACFILVLRNVHIF